VISEARCRQGAVPELHENASSFLVERPSVYALPLGARSAETAGILLRGPERSEGHVS
jgi:hypothetical protein